MEANNNYSVLLESRIVFSLASEKEYEKRGSWDTHAILFWMWVLVTQVCSPWRDVLGYTLKANVLFSLYSSVLRKERGRMSCSRSYKLLMARPGLEHRLVQVLNHCCARYSEILVFCSLDYLPLVLSCPSISVGRPPVFPSLRDLCIAESEFQEGNSSL